MFEQKALDWLESDYLRRLVRRVGYLYYLSSPDLEDLHQELCVALWKIGPERVVNATWVCHTAQHLAIDLLKSRKKSCIMGAAEVAIVQDSSAPDLELLSLIRAQAARLPASLRRFYQLRYEEGRTQEEILQCSALSRGLVRGIEKRFLRRMTGKRPHLDARSSSPRPGHRKLS